jgi:Ca2+-transporting ATPase
LLVAARKAGLQAEALETRLPRVSEVPFSSERKLMSTLHRDTEQQDSGIVFTKGCLISSWPAAASNSWVPSGVG